MTDNPSPHVWIARAATIAAVLFLVFLFIFPQLHVNRLYNELMPYAEKVAALVIIEDWDGAREQTQKMYEVYTPYDKKLRLYLDQQEVNSLSARISACKNLAMAEEDQILADLEDAKNKLNYLKDVETFSLWNLF